MKNDVWDVVPRLEGKFVVTSKIKHVADGSIEKYVIPKSCHHHVIRHLTFLLALNPSFWSGNSYHLSIFSYKFPTPCLILYP